MKPVREFFSLAPIAILTGALIFTTFAFQVIKESNSATAENQYLPALAEFDQSIGKKALALPVKPQRGEVIGTLTIPRLKKSIQIYEGTEVAQLKLGAGHYEKSVLPGAKDNVVIAGHRDSVFANFNMLQVDDELLIETPTEKFLYRIKSFRVVMANDRTVIVPTEIATLTLSTCYPFHFVGSAPKRFIVTAILTPSP